MISLPDRPRELYQAPSAPPHDRSRDNNFNILRVILAISVIYSHSFPILFGNWAYDPVGHLLGLQWDIPREHPIDIGRIAVDSFLVISGYLVTMSWQNSDSFADYLKRRLLRIYPGYIVAVLFSVFVTGAITAPRIGPYFKFIYGMRRQLLIYLIDLRYVLLPKSPQGSWNGSLWNIPFEFMCYLILACMAMFAACCLSKLPFVIRRLGPLIAFIVVYAVYAVHCYDTSIGWLGLSGTPIADHIIGPAWYRIVNVFAPDLARLLTYFCAGMCLYLYRDVVPYRRPVLLLSVAVLATSMLIIPAAAYTLPIFGSYLLTYLALARSPFQSFGRNFDLSYGIYLYAFPVQKTLVYFFKAHLTPTSLFAAALAITITLALLSWTLIERPCLMYAHRQRVSGN